MKKKEPCLFVTIVTILLLQPVCIFAQEARPAAAPAARPAFRMAPRIVSPEILPDNKVILRLYSKDALKVTVSGEWQTGFGGTQELVRNDTGMFSLTVGPLKPELYGYTINVDGVRGIDPNNVQVRRDGLNYQS